MSGLCFPDIVKDRPKMRNIFLRSLSVEPWLSVSNGFVSRVWRVQQRARQHLERNAVEHGPRVPPSGDGATKPRRRDQSQREKGQWIAAMKSCATSAQYIVHCDIATEGR